MKTLENEGYSYLKHLSTGGQGAVHLVVRSGDIFVAKIVPKLSDDAYKLMEHIASLNIPHTPKIIKLINTDVETIIIREYITGVTLLEEITSKGPLPLDRAKAIILTICETLNAFHQAKPHPIIYRDLKPDNIIITPDNHVFIIDFGIVRYYKQEATRDTIAIGTEGYTAPEVMAGMQSDARSDVYSAGLVLYEMVTGKNLLAPPYQIRPVAESDKRLPIWLDLLIEKATGMSAVTRFNNIDAFAHAVNHPRSLMRRRQKKLRLIVAAGVCVLAVTGGGLWYIKTLNAQEAAEAIVPLETAETQTAEETRKPAYTSILSLDFDDESEKAAVSSDKQVEIRDGTLIIPDWCNIDYIPSNGMLVHFRVKEEESMGAVALGTYRMNTSVDFECVYDIPSTSDSNTTWTKDLSGLPFWNQGQYIDYILYTTPENDIVYAVAADEEAGKIAYTGYQIPEETADNPLYISVMNFSGGQADIFIDFIYVADGSLSEYLADNISAYQSQKDNIERLFAQPADQLPEMTFKLMSEY